MNPYRVPGQVLEISQSNLDMIEDVIEESWNICRARQAKLIGPEPARWRVIAHERWRMSKREYAFMTPSVVDLDEAGDRLGATPDVLAILIAAHREVHR